MGDYLRNNYYNQPKYGNRKVLIDGITFASKKEAKRYQELKLLQQAGEISNLELQKKFVLIPAQREPDSVSKRGAVRKGKTIEREIAYVADFCYEDKDGNYIVEDTKGFKTPEYIIKRKLMLYLKQIRVKEI